MVSLQKASQYSKQMPTNIPTIYRIPTLMHNHTYRMAVAWQNAAYNQPPHVSYYMPDYAEYLKQQTTGIMDVEDSRMADDGHIYNLMGIRVSNPCKGIYIKDGKKIIISKCP